MDELNRLDRLLRAATNGAGQVVLLLGESGVGKSRLALEVADRAAAAGMLVVKGRAAADEGCPPYWLFWQILRGLPSVGPAGANREQAFAPDLDAAEFNTPTGSSTPLAARRFAMFEAVTDHLAATASARGLVALIDDLRWADAGSLHLLVHIASRIGGARVLIVATCRPIEAEARVRSAVAALTREDRVTRIELSGLANDEVGDLLAAVSGWPVPPSVAAAVERRTNRNPFYVAALGRLLTADSADRLGAALPATVRDVVQARLDRLSPTGRRVVCTAAVIGSAVDDRAVAAVLGLDLSAVWAAAEEAMRAGILTRGAVRRFEHDLVRDTAALDVPGHERARAHDAMVRYLLSGPDPAARTAEVAFHSLEALPLGSARTAFEWARRGADLALGQLAWEDASRRYARAADIAVEAGVPGDERHRLLVSLGSAASQGAARSRNDPCGRADGRRPARSTDHRPDRVDPGARFDRHPCTPGIRRQFGSSRPSGGTRRRRSPLGDGRRGPPSRAWWSHDRAGPRRPRVPQPRAARRGAFGPDAP